MAFKKINEQMKLSGFWVRNTGTTCQGIVKKIVPMKDTPFYIFELTEPCTDVQDDNRKKVKTKVGDYVGVGASATLSTISEHYIGAHVKLTAIESQPHKTRKKDGKPVMVRMFFIEVDIPEVDIPEEVA